MKKVFIIEVDYSYPMENNFDPPYDNYTIFDYERDTINLLQESCEDMEREFGATFQLKDESYKDFPVENEFIFKQLYAFTDAKIDIGLMVECDNCAYSFSYNLDSGKVRLIKHVFGTEAASLQLDSLADLLQLLNTGSLDRLNLIEN